MRARRSTMTSIGVLAAAVTTGLLASPLGVSHAALPTAEPSPIGCASVTATSIGARLVASKPVPALIDSARSDRASALNEPDSLRLIVAQVGLTQSTPSLQTSATSWSSQWSLTVQLPARFEGRTVTLRVRQASSATDLVSEKPVYGGSIVSEGRTSAPGSLRAAKRGLARLTGPMTVEISEEVSGVTLRTTITSWEVLPTIRFVDVRSRISRGNAVLTGRVLNEGGRPYRGGTFGSIRLAVEGGYELGSSNLSPTDSEGRFTVRGKWSKPGRIGVVGIIGNIVHGSNFYYFSPLFRYP